MMNVMLPPLLLLSLWLNPGIHAAEQGWKCGRPRVGSPAIHSARVVGGSEVPYGSQPWLVSLRNKASHFCGGAIVAERWVLSAAHCFAYASEERLGGVRVVAGEHDRRADDEEEQVLLVRSVSIHEKYHYSSPMDYDLALVEVDRPIRFGARVQPLCLPLPDETGPLGAACFVAGWGRTKERGRLPARPRRAQVDLVDPARCRFVLQTVRRGGVTRRSPAVTVLCAGPERGGRDACQGDSGGPLVCPAPPGSGRWEALGVASWGKGCGRSWLNNSGRPPSSRGSPGVYTDVRLMLPWIKQKLREGAAADGRRRGKSSTGLCSVRDGLITGSEGVITSHAPYADHYDNDELCVWSISVAPGYSILLEFNRFHLENDSFCRYDRLSILVGARRHVGIFCGSVLPGPVHLNNSHNATLIFSSDVSATATGFSLRYHAIREVSEPGCGAVVSLTEQGTVASPNYPQTYRKDCVVRWVLHAPEGHVVKLDFSDFELEESDGCRYDSLTVLADVEGTEEIALLCGGSVPPPVLTYHSVMVLHFTSDGSITGRGFRATVAFVSWKELQHGAGGAGSRGDVPRGGPHRPMANRGRVTSRAGLDGGHRRASQSSRSLVRPEDVAPPGDQGSDDEDYHVESSGTTGVGRC